MFRIILLLQLQQRRQLLRMQFIQWLIMNQILVYSQQVGHYRLEQKGVMQPYGIKREERKKERALSRNLEHTLIERQYTLDICRFRNRGFIWTQ